MKSHIETVTKLGRIPGEDRALHDRFAEWTSEMSPQNHQTVLEVRIAIAYEIHKKEYVFGSRSLTACMLALAWNLLDIN